MSNEIKNQLIEELNDLVHIQNDRIQGYENALMDVQAKNTDLKSVFQGMITTSIKQRASLTSTIAQLGGKIAEGTTISGKIYRAWMDIKATVTGKDREGILESCKYGEEAAQKAYDMALESDVQMSADLRQLLIGQQKELKSELDTIASFEELADKM